MYVGKNGRRLYQIIATHEGRVRRDSIRSSKKLKPQLVGTYSDDKKKSNSMSECHHTYFNKRRDGKAAKRWDNDAMDIGSSHESCESSDVRQCVSKV